VKFEVPAVVGVPEIVPVEPPSDSPAGSEPDTTDQLYGVTPPVAASVCEYATPIWPFGTLVVVITRSGGITIDRAFVAVSAGACESVTLTVKLEVPAVVGVPEITPPELKESPAGRLPELSDQLYGVTPPVAVSVWLYATPIWPFGRLEVVTDRSTGITIESAWSSVSGVPWESVTRTVKFEVPAVVGVPEIVPVEPPSDSPAGSEPDTTDQLYGVTPPVAASVWLYATPIWPFGTLVVVITRSGGIVIDKALVAVSAGVCESVTRTVKLEVPAVVGVPEITPPALKLSPAGRLPVWRDQEYGVTPPVAANVWLYATPIWPLGRLDVVTDRSAGITTLSAWSSVSGVLWESVTLTVKFEVPAVVGVPEIVPVELPRDSPAGRLPDRTDHVYGVVPPVAASVWLYATPIWPLGTLVVVITRSATPPPPSSGSAAIRAYLILAVPAAFDER
jgi:hypothetical protein